MVPLPGLTEEGLSTMTSQRSMRMKRFGAVSLLAVLLAIGAQAAPVSAHSPSAYSQQYCAAHPNTVGCATAAVSAAAAAVAAPATNVTVLPTTGGGSPVSPLGGFGLLLASILATLGFGLRRFAR